MITAFLLRDLHCFQCEQARAEFSVVWANPTHLSFLFTCTRLAAFAYNCAAEDEPEKIIDIVNDSPYFQVKNARTPEFYFTATIFAVAEAVTGTIAREDF